MSVLVILLPPRERLSSRSADATPGMKLPPEFEFVFSADGRSATRNGYAAPFALPKADEVVLVLADGDASWHRIDIPKAPPARLRAALAGAMEELLLDDDDVQHLALAADAVPGQPGWVAVVHKPWLASALALLDGAGLPVDRVLPALCPGQAATGHFFVTHAGVDGGVALALGGADGVVCLRLGGLARALLPAVSATAPDATEHNAPGTNRSITHYTATPAAAAAAERWLGAPVQMLGAAERALQAARAPGNLRQFDLARRSRGLRALLDALRRLRSPAWRPVRWGLAALVAVQLVGLNAWAWQQRQALVERQLAMNALLRESFPGVRAVLDAPLQMQRETDRLRAAAGRPGDADLEVLLAAAAAAWPDNQGPVQALQFEAGRLVLSAPGWGEAELAQLRVRLRSAGFGAELVDGRVTVARLTVPGAA